MKVLIACECSGTVRDAFIALGHDAISCDLCPSDRPGPHYQCDVFDIIDSGFDLMIAHPPCTYIAVSGMHWTARGLRDPKLTEDAVEFFMKIANADIPRIAIENPVCIMSTRWRAPDQYIQPWWFGDDASKKTGLWLKNLPLLKPTNMLPGDAKTRRANQTASGQNKLGPSPDRAKIRAVTYPGIARAMAEQWGSL